MIASHVGQVLRAARKQFHDNYGVDRCYGNALASMGAFQAVLDDAQRFGQRHLINVDSVELNDGNSHCHKAAFMFLERFIPDQKVDVRGCAGAITIGIGAKRADQGMTNARLGEHLRDLAHSPLVGRHQPQRMPKLWFRI